MFSNRIFNNLVIALFSHQILNPIQCANLMGIIHIDLWAANLIEILCPDGKTKQLDLFLVHPTGNHLIKFFLPSKRFKLSSLRYTISVLTEKIFPIITIPPNF